MNKEMIFELNLLADTYEQMAKSYRIVANDMAKLQNGIPKQGRRHYDDPSLPYVGPKRKAVKVHVGGVVKGHKYKPGSHWMQKPENKAKVMKTIRKMQRARNGK
jgi:hypothetical protein